MAQITVEVRGPMMSGKSWVIAAITDVLRERLGIEVWLDGTDMSDHALQMRLDKLHDGKFDAKKLMRGLEVRITEKNTGLKGG